MEGLLGWLYLISAWVLMMFSKFLSGKQSSFWSMLGMMEPPNELIKGEVKRTLDFFSSNFSQDRISNIILSGGSSKVPNIVETLQDITDIDVELANPFNNIAVNETEFDPKYISDISPQMGVVIGLALRRIGDN